MNKETIKRYMELPAEADRLEQLAKKTTGEMYRTEDGYLINAKALHCRVMAVEARTEREQLGKDIESWIRQNPDILTRKALRLHIFGGLPVEKAARQAAGNSAAEYQVQTKRLQLAIQGLK